MAKENENGTVRYVFIYDADGNPHELHYYSGYDDTTPIKYFYVLNLQGDVIQLRDSSNAVVANYTYDAWGRLISVKNASGSTISDATHIANVNPIRYRGYFYDTETKLYYCNSRYYDPQIKRFINADEYLSTGQDFYGYNMFAYCNNNPVMRSDPNGYFSFWDGLDVVSFVSSVVNVVTNPTDPMAWAELAGDTVDLLPIVTGIGETVRAVNAVDDVYGAVKAVDNVADVADDVHDVAKITDNGADLAQNLDVPAPVLKTGRDFPRDLNEQLALESIKSSPLDGKVILENLGDTNLPNGNYYKYQKIFNTQKGSINIHYVGDPVANNFFDFKFKYSYTDNIFYCIK